MIAAIIDSHPVFLNGLTQFLYESFKTVDVIRSETVTSFNSARGDLRPDFLIIGVNSIFRNNDLKTFERLARSLPDSRTIVFYDRLEMVIPFLKSGVNGFLAKNGQPEELSDCLDTVLKGRRYLNNEVFDLIVRNNL